MARSAALRLRLRGAARATLAIHAVLSTPAAFKSR
jgi:hypothetical protein